ncbi:hypothetical protein ACJRO7_016237 [Eucalyptus globulus]|uniref:Lachrymatory factor synthase n=1 Tax=Eucalyptus globulus TaxID=34317 RepID=A0ABD3L766_EUCGL
MASEAKEKWGGKVRALARGSGPDQVWPLLEDFFSLYKWVPTIDTCYGVEGVSGEPGCVQYCSGTRSPADGFEDVFTEWALEKLLATDPINKSFTYEIVNCNNVGISQAIAAYLPTLTAERDAEEEDGCGMSRSFTVNPIEGWTERFDGVLQCCSSSHG